MRERFKKQIKLQRGSNAMRTMKEINRRNNELRCDEDAIIRTEIHGIIISGIKEGRNKEEIINKLSQNLRYRKYEIYFENWINDRIKKLEKNNKELEK